LQIILPLSPAFNYEKLQRIASFGISYYFRLSITSKSCLMKRAFTLSLLLIAINIHGFAAAKYKPAFYDRAMAAIHTPVPGEVVQAPLPPPNLAQMPASDPHRHWYHGLSERTKATWGWILLIAGGVFLVCGLGLYIYGATGPEHDDWAGVIAQLFGVLFGCAGLGMGIPGFILHHRYG
jgi:hypothetical protein